jgi:hypothetical protein
MVAGCLPIAIRWGLKSGFARIFIAAFLSPLALIFNWIAFEGGPRDFARSVTIAGTIVQQGTASESVGRLVFGTGAVMLDLLALVIAVRWILSKVA